VTRKPIEASGQDRNGLDAEGTKAAVRDSGCANSSSLTHPISREAVARIIDPEAWERRERALQMAAEARGTKMMQSSNLRYADDFVRVSLAKADQIISLIGRDDGGRERAGGSVGTLFVDTPTNAMIAAGERVLIDRQTHDPDNSWWGYAKKVWLAMEAKRLES